MKFNVSITMRNTTTGYELRAANLAPRLADALEQALATVAERDAEIARLQNRVEELEAALQPFTCILTKPASEEEWQRAADALKGGLR